MNVENTGDVSCGNLDLVCDANLLGESRMGSVLLST
jgi:hypothetical protein